MKEIILNEKTGRYQVRSINDEPTMTQQQFGEETDINNIMKKYQQTGELPNLSVKEGKDRKSVV